MKQLKKAFYAAAILLASTSIVNAQEASTESTEPTFSFNEDGSINFGADISVGMGDTLTINVPAAGDFAYVTQQKKKSGLGKITKIGNIGGHIGSAVGSLGALGGNLGALKTGIDIMQAGDVVYSSGRAAEEIADLNLSGKAKKLVGKKLVIVSIQRPQDAAMGMVGAVAKEVDGKKLFDVALMQAFYTGEILVDGKHVSSLYTKKEKED